MAGASITDIPGAISIPIGLVGVARVRAVVDVSADAIAVGVIVRIGRTGIGVVALAIAITVTAIHVACIARATSTRARSTAAATTLPWGRFIGVRRTLVVAVQGAIPISIGIGVAATTRAG